MPPPVNPDRFRRTAALFEAARDLDAAARAAHDAAYAVYRANYNEQLAWHEEGRGL